MEFMKLDIQIYEIAKQENCSLQWTLTFPIDDFT